MLPWVRLHALKDYADMPALLENFPGVRATFNIVPSLLQQLAGYAGGQFSDRHLELSWKTAVDLTDEERVYLLRDFFSFHWGRVLPRFPRLAELLERRGREATASELSQRAAAFSTQDLLDLQVLFHLAWCGNLLLEREPIRTLAGKGRSFSEEEKRHLLQVQQEFLDDILPIYRRLAAEGRVEVSVSPSTHPILPLLVDTDLARRSDEHVPLPRRSFRYPQDAASQIGEAMRLTKEEFGLHCRGMWPSEGSVSQELAPLWSRHGVRWVASDEQVLWNSIRRAGLPDPSRSLLYSPYRLSGSWPPVAIFFRDHELSDLPGFVYAHWGAERAARDFVERLLRIGDAHRGPTPPVVTVILDGENAWEHYQENGRPFLTELYGLLEKTPGIGTSTFSDWLDRHEGLPELPPLHPGSWIYGNFNTWIGHPEKNRAWEELSAAREALQGAEQAEGRAGGEGLAAAREALWRAEASDWFWWYGDDHVSSHKAEFDQLFRACLRAVYESLGLPAPDVLHRSLRREATPEASLVPAALVQPTIDGRNSHYFEWLGAVSFAARGGAMHPASGRLVQVLLGYDTSRIFLRLDFRDGHGSLGVDVRVHIWLAGKRAYLVPLAFHADGAAMVPAEADGQAQACLPRAAVEVAWSRCLEVALSAAALELQENDRMEVRIEVLEDGKVVERWPHDNPWAFRYAPRELEESGWYV